MKILLTGASGLLGAAIQKQAQAQGAICQSFSRSTIDWMNMAKIIAIVQEFDCVIHAAANTNVEACEENPSACFRDNYLLTDALAKAAQKVQAKFVFVSSTGVYGRHKSVPYREYDLVCPTTIHHQSKYIAEQAVIGWSPNNLVIRTGWLFGGEELNPKNFVARRIDEALAALGSKKNISSNGEQWGVPCFSEDVAKCILFFVESDLTGVFNCVNSGTASRFEYVKEIINLARIPVEVKLSDALLFKRKANVSNNEMAENWRADMLGLPPMPDWKESLKNYIKSKDYFTTGRHSGNS